MNDLLERFAGRGVPVGAEAMIDRVEQELAGVLRSETPRRQRPWLAVALAAALVLVVVGGGVLVLARSGDEAAAPAALPSGGVVWPEFEMYFMWWARQGEAPPAALSEVADQDRVLRLLWSGGTSWRIDEFEVGGPTLRLVESVVVHEGYRYVVGKRVEPPEQLGADGVAPYSWLAEVPPSLAWTRARPVPDSEPVIVEPSHPLASIAAESDRMRMEFTTDGIPVLWRMDEVPMDFHVLSIDRRTVTIAEIEAGLAEAGAFRSPAIGEVVRTVGGDGFTAELVVGADCLDVVVRSDGALLMAGGGCVLPADPPDEAILDTAGAVLPDGRWLEVFAGGPATTFTRIEVTYPDGSVHVDDLVDGYWLLAVPSDVAPTGYAVRAIDETGLEVSAGEVVSATPEG